MVQFFIHAVIPNLNLGIIDHDSVIFCESSLIMFDSNYFQRKPETKEDGFLQEIITAHYQF